MAATVSIIIPTKNAGEGFAQTLEMIYAQNYGDGFEVIIIDSGSADQTLEIARRYLTKIYAIKPEEFGHGRTRNLGAKLAAGQYLVFTTGDAVPATEKWLANLIRNFADAEVAGVYGRQIPRQGINPMEYFFLTSKYPSQRAVKQALDGKTDIDTIFFSDVNSALRREIWEKYPFDDRAISGEDQIWSRQILKRGYKTIYDPEAAVYHSHDFGLKGVFQKYFDCGISYGWFAAEEYASGRFISQGLKYVKQELQFLIGNGHTKWLPYAILYDLAKFFGVSLGKNERYLPLSFKKLLSSNGYYWGREAEVRQVKNSQK